ncbi:UNVERIFIED_CONTAM: hypothetical protein PYX00_009990 [Menopon gallinae]|uniref:Uncharacterized protein n=1 Tax=Menopon gallinae TaxID=328185 RepID=A0AAW2HDQ3_9NEOP
METDRRGIDVVEGERCAEDACAANRADAFPSAARELGDGISQIGVFTEGEDQRNLGEFSHFFLLSFCCCCCRRRRCLPFPFFLPPSARPAFRAFVPRFRPLARFRKPFPENRRPLCRNVLLTRFENTRFSRGRGGGETGRVAAAGGVRGGGRKSIPKVMFFSCSVWKMSHSRGRFRKLGCFR